VHQKGHVHLDAALPLALLLLSQLRGRAAGHVNSAKGVLVQIGTVVAQAVRAEVDVARRTMMTVARIDLNAAVGADGRELGRVGVVQVVEHHHGAVLGSTELVELIVVALAQGKEGRPRVKMFRVLRFIHVLGVVLHVGKAAGNASLVEDFANV
jgi:hypothetical protein